MSCFCRCLAAAAVAVVVLWSQNPSHSSRAACTPRLVPSDRLPACPHPAPRRPLPVPPSRFVSLAIPAQFRVPSISIRGPCGYACLRCLSCLRPSVRSSPAHRANPNPTEPNPTRTNLDQRAFIHSLVRSFFGPAPHDSRLTPHASRLTPHDAPLTPAARGRSREPSTPGASGSTSRPRPRRGRGALLARRRGPPPPCRSPRSASSAPCRPTGPARTRSQVGGWVRGRVGMFGVLRGGDADGWVGLEWEEVAWHRC